MNVLITGGCGFLGRRLVRFLYSQNVEAFTFDNLDKLCGPEGEPDLRGDILSQASLEYAIGRFDITHIAHLAAYGRNLTCKDYPERAMFVNVQGTQNVLEAAKRHKVRAIVCSSNIVLSDQRTVYKQSKQATEALVRNHAAINGDCMALRPSNMYGPGQSKTEYQPCAFAGLDISYQKHGKFTVTGDGTQTRDWIHADDVSRAFWLSLQSKLTGNVLDVCSGEQVSLNKIAKMLGVPVEYTEPRPGDARALVSNPEPASRLLGFKAEIKLSERIWDAFPSVPRLAKV